MQPEPFRGFTPQLSPEHMKTYAIVRKDGVHMRPATCAEVECEQWAHGWVTRVPRGSKMAQFIEGNTHGRTWAEVDTHGAPEREFRFLAGQPCFRSSTHRRPIEREPLFVVRDGDWRGNPRGTPAVQRTADDWVDDFANHQQQIAEARDRG